jgi:hypothetical protein
MPTLTRSERVLRWTLRGMIPAMTCLLIGSVLLSSGCGLSPVRNQMVLDQKRPYRLSQPVQAQVWGKTSDGKAIEQDITIPAGWWVAGPLVIGE